MNHGIYLLCQKLLYLTLVSITCSITHVCVRYIHIVRIYHIITQMIRAHTRDRILLLVCACLNISLTNRRKNT